MQAKCYELDEASKLGACAPDRAPALSEPSAAAGAVVWLDLSGDDDEGELATWLDKLEVRGLSRRIILEARDRPGFYPLETEIVMVLPLAHGPTDRTEREHVVFLCRDNLLVTVQRSAVSAFEELAALEDSEQWVPGRSVAGLTSALIYGIAEHGLLRVSVIRNRVLALAKRMTADPGAVTGNDVLSIRAEILKFGIVVGDQVPQVQALLAASKSFFAIEHARAYLQIAETNVRAAERGLEWLDQQISSLRSGVEMHAQERTNRRLNTLTLVTAVFAPASLLTGVWGMNFANMLELNVPYAYPVALGIMVASSLAVYLYFRRSGWFD